VKILEETEVALERADLNRRSPIARTITKLGKLHEPKRTKGIHASGILRYVVIESGMMKVLAQMDEEDFPLRMALGLAWEEFAVSLYPEIHWQPGECIEQGIVMTCDGHSLYVEEDPIDGGTNVHALCIEEFKLTWKKRRDAETFTRDEWHWLQQGRGYCWGYGAHLVRWHVCYVMGDYKGGGPVYMRYLIQFDDRDLETTGRMLIGNREKAVEKGYCEI